MRNIFLALLAANLVYFAWAHWVDGPKPAPVNEALQKLPRLKLVSELPPGQQPQTNTKTVFNESASCLSVGPFGDMTNAAKAAGLLTSKGFAPRQRAEQGDTAEGFWVYVGGLKDEVEADRVRVSLEHAGVKDALVMPPGGDSGRRISLGLFSDRAHAEQRAASLKRMGFKAEVAEHKLPQTIYWIDLAPRPGMTTVPLQDLFAEGVGSRIAVQPCPVAPGPGPAASAAAVPATTEGVSASSGALPAPGAARYPLPAAIPPQPASTAPTTRSAAAPRPTRTASSR